MTLEIACVWLFTPPPSQVWVAVDPGLVTQNLTGTAPIVASPQIAWPDYSPALGSSGWKQVAYNDGSGWTPVITVGIISFSQIYIELGTVIFDPVTSTTHYDISGLENVGNCNWDGSLNIGVQIERGTGGVFTGANQALTISELAFFTGVAGEKAAKREDERVRAVRDARYGMPNWHDQVVEDEYIERLWVRQDDRDPEDPRREYDANPKENVRDDDVPLE
jgi:hypothetical protein